MFLVPVILKLNNVAASLLSNILSNTFIMTKEKKEYTQQKSDKPDDTFKNDPETLNTTDPQEHMQGPLSSLMHKVEGAAEDNDKKDKEENQNEK